MQAQTTRDSGEVAALTANVGRARLPYGSVMATAGASALAGRCGMQSLAAPLLAIAALLALWVPLAGVWAWRGRFAARCRACLALGPAHQHVGVHTVPLGLAVITGSLLALAVHDAPSALLHVAVACTALMWVLTLASVGRFIVALATQPITLHALDGAWFLAPAALSGAGMATADLAMQAHGAAASVLVVLALAGAIAGWFGYWVLAMAAAVRVSRCGLGGEPQASWWIAMGCAGLAAAALGSVSGFAAAQPTLQRALIAGLVLAASMAVLLCVPVLVLSGAFLLRRCRFRDAAAWPPTFSTAVFALGCLAAGASLGSSAFRSLGFAAGDATVCLWLVTAGWNSVHGVRGAWRRWRDAGSARAANH